MVRTGWGILCFALVFGDVGAAGGRPPAVHCGKTKLFREHRVTAWSTSGHSRAMIYKSGFAIDADGAAQAYHPDDAPGLDALKHAGHPGNWWALVTDNQKRGGRPILQGEGDPAPGFYVSMTALYDPDRASVGDPKRYVDAAEIPYVVLHPRALHFAKLGDFATVVNLKNGKVAGAIVADESAARLPVGEGSIALADALDIDSDARTGGQDKNIVYVVYPGSGNGKPREAEEIAAQAERLFEAWGGLKRVKACFAQ